MTLKLRIRTRLTLAYSLISLLLLVGLGVTLYVALSMQLNDAADSELKSGARAVIQFVQKEEKAGELNQLPDELREHAELDTKNELVQMRTQEGQWLYRSPGIEMLQLEKNPRAGFSTLVVGKRTFRTVRTEIHLTQQKYILEMAIDRSEYKEATESLASLLMLAIPLSTMLAFMAGFWMSGRVLQPIQRITRTVGEIDANKLAVRLPVTLAGDELDHLSAMLNRMLDRLQSAFERIGRFTADASHELRTPLALIRGNAEMMRSETPLPRLAEARTLDIIAEADRMRALIHDLLDLARHDSVPAVSREIIDPSDIAIRAEQVGSNLAASKGLRFTVEHPKAMFPLYGNDSDLSRMLVILLDNAVRFTPPGGEVRLLVTCTPIDCTFQVSDTGPGIRPEHLPHIFDRFYRIDDSRNRATGGTGLGLSIAQAIVSAHNGAITVESRPDHGSTFTVVIPTSNSA